MQIEVSIEELNLILKTLVVTHYNRGWYTVEGRDKKVHGIKKLRELDEQNYANGHYQTSTHQPEQQTGGLSNRDDTGQSAFGDSYIPEQDAPSFSDLLEIEARQHRVNQQCLDVAFRATELIDGILGSVGFAVESPATAKFTDGLRGGVYYFQPDGDQVQRTEALNPETVEVTAYE